MFDTVRPGTVFTEALVDFPAGSTFSLTDAASVTGLPKRKTQVVLGVLKNTNVISRAGQDGYKINADQPPPTRAGLAGLLRTAQGEYETKRRGEGTKR